MARKKRKMPAPQKRVRILVVIAILLILINVYNISKLIIIANNREKAENPDTAEVTGSENVTAQEIEQNAKDRELEGLINADERTRIQQYCGTFIRHIENGEYDKAYDLLYPDFKTNYFKTLEDFTKYVQEKFPSDLIVVSYDNIERQGQYYILFTTITSPLRPDYSMEERFFFVENDFNDFKVSFEVKQ